MSEAISITIDGKECKGTFGETILQIARREGIYIPTMCYLSKVSPIASCRMCVVEVEGVDGLVLSCQEKAVDGAVITTNNKELWNHRQNIMKLYDVNHPLQCGVCDKSGECDLQNKTLEFRVDSQEFSAKDQKRELNDWGLINYDASLCIMCEKCVHVCNEVIGDDAIEISVGGYKSTIVPKGSDVLDCTFCGECIAVCPVGAMTSGGFKYRANAWELTRVPAACAHCSSGCHLYYEVKHTSHHDNSLSIFRVKNDEEFSTLCGAGRFGYDFENRVASKDKAAFDKVVDILKNRADTIKFNSFITNEEALILQKLKEKLGLKLVNKEARHYQKFLKSFSKRSGDSLYNGNLEEIKKSDYVIVVGTMISSDNPLARYALTVASKKNSAKITYFHPIMDELLRNVVTTFVKHEAGAEEGAIALLAKYLIKDEKIDKKLDIFDEGYISAESNIGEEEMQKIANELKRAKNPTLILGPDLYSHPRAKNIAHLAGLIQKYTDFKVVIIPTNTNTLGVSLICDLDDECGEYVVGYNEDGDFKLSALGDGDLDMLALNQQEGTFTNIDKRVVPTNVALPYSGYVLNDIANALGLESEYTIDYTKELPINKGYKAIEFDDLENYYTNAGEERRGYKLEVGKVESKDKFEDIAEIESYDGTIIYECNPILQFSEFTAKCHILKEEGGLYLSEELATELGLENGSKVSIEFGDEGFVVKAIVDKDLKGKIAKLPNFDKNIPSKKLFDKSRYVGAKIVKQTKEGDK
jgi:NADH-quinone oxidoreductase subunit G